MINRNSKTRKVQLKALKPKVIIIHAGFRNLMKPQIIIILEFSKARFFAAQIFECRADVVFPFAVINVTGRLRASVHKQEFSCLIQPFGRDHGFK